MRNVSTVIKIKTNKHYYKMMVHIPSQIAGDSQIPFKFGDKIRTTIETQNGHNRVVIEKLENTPPIQEEFRSIIPASSDPQKQKPQEENAMNRQLSETDTIICPKCNNKNLLLNKTSPYRRCTYCGHEMLKPDYVYYRPEPENKTEKPPVISENTTNPEAAAIPPSLPTEPPERSPIIKKPFLNSDIMKCPGCGTENIVIPGGKGRKCRSCGFGIKQAPEKDIKIEKKKQK